MNNHNNFKVGEIVSIVQPNTVTDYGLAKITKLNPSKAKVVMTKGKRPRLPNGAGARVPYAMLVKLDSQPKPANEVKTADVTKSSRKCDCEDCDAWEEYIQTHEMIHG